MADENNMRGELRYAHSKVYSRIAWLIFYAVALSALVLGSLNLLNHIETRTLPAGQIQLSIPYSKYALSDTVTFTIKNGFNSPIYLANNCPSEPLRVYRQENDAWVRIHDTAASSDCPAQNRQIEVAANTSVNGNFGPWHHLFNVPGKYRVVAYVEYYNALPYQDFKVLANAPAPKPADVTPITKQPTYYTPAPAPTRTPTRTFTEPSGSGDD